MPTGYYHHHGPSGTSAYASAATRPSSTVAATSSSGVSAQQLQRFDVLLRRPENRECFDCSAKQPRWASTNLGVFFCLRCAGVHRSMGTHISKVKSTNMDAWEESMIQVMEHIGNARGRLLYEYNMPASAKVTSFTETSIVERAIRAKYEKKIYYNPKYAELYKQFMATPIEGVADRSAEGGANVLSPPPGANAPPRRLQPSQAPPPPAPPQEPVKELWGAPVTSPNALQPGLHGNRTASNNSTASRTAVAELFAATNYNTGGGLRQQPVMAFGSAACPATTANAPLVLHASASPNASPTSVSGDSDWFNSNFGRSNGNPLGSNVPSPATPQSPHTAQSSRNNTDDLLQTPRGTGSSKDEILSLFTSAPIAGAGGQTSQHSSPNNTHPMAWQPQTVKPYYYPE